MAYLIDANVLVEAFKGSYPLDIAEGFWRTLAAAASDGKILSIDRVKAEVFKNEDALTQWCDDQLPDRFFGTSQGAFQQYRQIINWANQQFRLSPIALSKLAEADNADAWLVAEALRAGHCVVTLEVSAPMSRNNVKIPDICSAHGVDCCSTMEMFRRLKLKF